MSEKHELCQKCQREHYCQLGPPMGDSCGRYMPEKPPMTNGDKFRAMSDEEIADFIAHHGSDCIGERDDYPSCRHCEKCWLEWLKQEAK